MTTDFDVAVIGGGPAGSTAATELARQGARVMLLDPSGRIKPCGGAIPPRLIEDFEIPAALLKGRATAARMVSPSARVVDMPVGDGFVGMVDREEFDEWLRERARGAGAKRVTGIFERIERSDDGRGTMVYRTARGGDVRRASARCFIGADGARSSIAHQEIRNSGRIPCVFAYHEIVRSPPEGAFGFDGARAEVHYRGDFSSDFYAWIFPHGETTSIGVGSAVKGADLRRVVKQFRAEAGFADCETIRGEGAPIPLKPLKRWDNGRDVVLAGDAAGVVAPSSGEGIYYAMASGREAASAAMALLETGDARALRRARTKFMRAHGLVFFILGVMQHYWYSSDKRRERFVRMCADPDVQHLTWQAYMNKRLVGGRPLAHARIFLTDLAHLARSRA